MTCWSCLNGHRASTCQHSTRPLYALKNKGRPRPQGFSRSKEHPDILSLDDPSFDTFYQMIMDDPILRKEYFHAEDPAKSPKKRGSAPYVKRSSSRNAGKVAVDMYAGKCSDADISRWRELCGVVGVVFGDVSVVPTSLPLWPTATMFPYPYQPELPIHTPLSTISTESPQSTFSTMDANIGDTENMILSPSSDAFIMPSQAALPIHSTNLTQSPECTLSTLSIMDTNIVDTGNMIFSTSSETFIMPPLQSPTFGMDDIFHSDMSTFDIFSQFLSSTDQSEPLNAFTHAETSSTNTAKETPVSNLLLLPDTWESEFDPSLCSDLFGDNEVDANHFSTYIDCGNVVVSY